MTHGNFMAGEQKTRDYDWTSNPRICEGSGNPTNHPFGYGEQPLYNGAKKAVMPERFEETFPKTIIVKRQVEDYKAVALDPLAQSRNLGQGVYHIHDPNVVFGIKNNLENWNAAKCITGEEPPENLQPDKDLGKSVRANCTNNYRKQEDVGRSFGVPSIRVDVPYKAAEKRSVADYGNYGDDPEAVDLLFPATFTELGISEYDFQLPRSREQIQALFEKIGYQYKVGKFNTMYNKAKEMCNSQNDMVSVRSFMLAVNSFHDLE